VLKKPEREIQLLKDNIIKEKGNKILERSRKTLGSFFHVKVNRALIIIRISTIKDILQMLYLFSSWRKKSETIT